MYLKAIMITRFTVYDCKKAYKTSNLKVFVHYYWLNLLNSCSSECHYVQGHYGECRGAVLPSVKKSSTHSHSGRIIRVLAKLLYVIYMYKQIYGQCLKHLNGRKL